MSRKFNARTVIYL